MPSFEPRRILTFAQYARRRHRTPYVVEIESAGARLTLFGSQHSSDPEQPMFAELERRFVTMAPTFALHEGTPPHPEREREIAIRRHCEAGLVVHLAARAGIATASMDIPLSEEARQLRAALPVREALVYLVTRQLASYNRKTAKMDAAQYFADFFALIAPGLGLREIDWPMVEDEFAQLMGYRLVASAVSARETDPMFDGLPTQRISRLSNRLRDEHMLSRLAAALTEQERVFASVGVSHAVMLEPALRGSD